MNLTKDEFHNCLVLVSDIVNLVDKNPHLENKAIADRRLEEITAFINDVRRAYLKNQKIIEQLEHRKKHPQAMNYAQFEVWVTDILNGGNGFPVPKFLGVEN